MSNTINLTEELAAAVDRLDYQAIEGLTKSIGESTLEHSTAEDMARFIRMLAVKIMLKRVQGEAGLTSSTRKE